MSAVPCCVACGAARVHPKLRKDGVQIHACADCGLAFWQPEAGFTPRELYDAAYFGDAEARHGYDDYAQLESSLRATFARRLARLPPPRAGARLLDLGAAFGFAVDEARRAGWRAVGLELSAAAARRAAGGVAVGSALEAPFASDSFDAVTLWDALEHLPDPHAAIGEAARLLREGGRLVISTGDVESLAARVCGAHWHLYTLPEHLFFFSRRSLRLLLEAHGLSVESVRAEAAVYTLGYLAERLRKTLLGRPARRAADWPGAGLRLPVNLFDIVTVRAVRQSR